MIAALVTAALALAAGVPIAMALPAPNRKIDLRFIGEALMLGVAAQAAVLFILAMLGIRWSATLAVGGLAAVAAAAAIIAARRGPWTLARPRLSLIDLVTLVLIAGYTRFATLAPTVEIDFVGIWGLKAREFFVAHGIDWWFLSQPFNSYAHVDYPLLVPLAYDFQWLIGGGWNDRWAGLLTAVCGLATLLVLRGVLEEEERGWVVPVATLVLMPMAFSPYIAIAEGPLIAFATAAMLRARDGDVLRAGVLLGLAASCKNEGITLLAAVAIGLIVAGAARLVPRLWPALVIAVPWLVIRHLHGLQTDLTESGIVQRTLMHLRDPLPMLRTMEQYPAGRLLFWVGVGSALLIGARRVVREERFLATALLVQFAAFIAAYVITPHDVSWHVRWSWERVVMQLAAPLGFLAVVVLFGPPASAPRPETG